MRRNIKAIIVLITTIIFTNSIDLYAQNKEKQLLDATTAQGLWVKVNPDKNARIERLNIAKSKVFGKDQLLSFDEGSNSCNHLNESIIYTAQRSQLWAEQNNDKWAGEEH